MQVTTGTTPVTVAAFNINGTDNELYAFNTTTQRQSIGTLIGDFTGDGRSGILRWEDDPTKNALFLSNGDGSFRKVTPTGLVGMNQVLRHSDGKTSYLAGDFSGRGTLEILRIKDTLAAGSEGTTNQIYERSDKSPPDQLLSVTSPTGLKTTLTWAPLTNSSASQGDTPANFPRYLSDRGTTLYARYPQVDLMMPMYVVIHSVSDTGVGTSQTFADYAYVGLKADINRGLLGFRQTTRQVLSPIGTTLTQTTQRLQLHPYIGATSVAWTNIGALADEWANSKSLAGDPNSSLSKTLYTYCDKSPGAGTEGAASPTLPCPTTAKVQKPYLFTTVESGVDPLGFVLPTVTTVNAFDLMGNPTNIAVTTKGNALGLNQTFTKSTANTYLPDNTAGDNWVLGRLQQATQRNAVPISLASIPTSAGSAVNASATQGSSAPPTISPAVLSAILQLLLDD